MSKTERHFSGMNVFMNGFTKKRIFKKNTFVKSFHKKLGYIQLKEIHTICHKDNGFLQFFPNMNHIHFVKISIDNEFDIIWKIHDIHIGFSF